MTSNREQEIKSLFQEALDLEPSEQDAFLAERCSKDPRLKARVESLLRYHQQEDGILDSPPDFAALGLPSPPERSKYEPGQTLVGTEIGPYRLQEFLGQGGMGLVYLAEQQRPVRRRVALKIVKSVAEATEVLARFESERQALALMNHPSIARIFDANTTEGGRPYFTMEYVTGVPITEYCDQQGLTVPERLGLFLRVCDGVQHAHQKGILHRDLKPSNILVTVRDGKPMPKIIDFGVAKALHHPLASDTPITSYGSLVGTPGYMSPEQAFSDGQDIDTRADIYSLGVLLYELLCGVLPLDPRNLTVGGHKPPQGRRAPGEPLPPSLRVAKRDDAEQIAQRRRTQPRQLRRLLRQDLDWVTMRALEPERQRRYPTVSDLSADIERFLAGETVRAGPPSVRYRLRKYVKRNKVLLIAVAAVVLALGSGLVASLNFAYRAESASKIAAESANSARRAGRRAETITEYMKSVLLKGSPHRGGNPDLTLREALTRADGNLDEILQDAPDISSAVRITVAEIYYSLCLYEKALLHASQAVAELRASPKPNRLDLASGLKIMALAHSDRGEFAEAKPLFREALALYRESLGEASPEVAELLTNLVNIQSQIGDFQETARSYRELIAWQEQNEGPESLDAGMSQMFFGNLLAGHAVYDEGLARLERSLQILEHQLGPGHSHTSMARYYLGSLYRRKGDFEIATGILTAACDSLRQHMGDDHRQTLMAERDLAACWSGLGRYAPAESLFAAILARQRRTQGGENLTVAFTLLFEGDNYSAWGHEQMARACYRQALDIAEATTPGSDHILKARTLQGLAILDQAAGQWRAARLNLETCLQQYRRLLRPDHPHTLEVLWLLAQNLTETQENLKALPLLQEYYAGVAREFGPRDARAAAAARLIVDAYERSNSRAPAAAWRAWLAGDRSVPMNAREGS
jgi:serine/threonine protein kinase